MRKSALTIIMVLLLLAGSISAQAAATMKMESSSFGQQSLYLAVWNYALPSISDLLGKAPLFELKVTNGFDQPVMTEFTFKASYQGVWGEANGWATFQPIPVPTGTATYKVDTSNISLDQLISDLGAIKGGSNYDSLKQKYLGDFGTWVVHDSYSKTGDITVDKIVDHLSSGSTDFPAGLYEVTISARYQDPVQGWLPLAEKRYSFQVMSAIGSIDLLEPLPYQIVSAEPTFRWRNPQLPTHVGYVNTIVGVEQNGKPIWTRELKRSAAVVGGKEDSVKFNDNNVFKGTLIGGETYTWWVELKDVGNADYGLAGRQIQRSQGTFTLPNTAPRASITTKPNSDLLEGTAFTFIGSYSDTEDQQLGKTTKRQWYVNGKAQGTANKDEFSYTFTSAGAYSIEYRVTDYHGSITQAYANVNVTKNAPPVATITTPAAGLAEVGTELQLRAQVSDPDSSTVTAKWSVNGRDLNTEILQSNGNRMEQMLTSTVRLPLQSAGTHKITLTVTDSNGGRSTQTVEVIAFTLQAPRVTITSPNPSQKVVLGDKITLQASGQDETGLKYLVTWYANGQQLPSSTNTLEISQSQTVLEAKSTRSSATGALTGSARVEIKAAANQGPNVRIANPVSGLQVNLNETVQFTAAATDPEGDAVAYAWTATTPSGARTSLGSGESVPFQLTQQGEYTISVVATDIGRAQAFRLSSAPSEVRVLVIKPTPSNAAPTVAITAPSNGAQFQSGDTLSLNASASDPNGDEIHLLWRLAGKDIGSGTTLQHKLDQVPEGIALDANGYASMKLQVTASDLKGGTSQAEVTVKIKPVALPQPVIGGVTVPTSGVTEGYTVGDAVSLTANMAKGTAVRYRWLLDDEDKGSNASLQLTFVKSGRQTVTLEAIDQFGNVGRALVTFAVAPNQPPQLVLTSTPDRPVTQGESLKLTATVTDVENKYNSVEWKIDGNPVPTTWISGDKAQVLTFPTTDVGNPTAKIGTYMVTAQVNDNVGQKANDVNTVVVQAPRVAATPTANQVPLVQIDGPRSGDPVFAGDSTPLIVSVADAEAGKIKVTWLINGEAVSGEATVTAGNKYVQATATYTFTQAGSYPMIVRVADEAGGQKETMVTVQVQSKQGGDAVNAQIVKPLPNAFTTSDAEVEFEAINVPAGATVEWKSDQDGKLGTSATLSKLLTNLGAHRVSLLVDGNEADFRNITVAGNVEVRQIVGTIYQPNTACTIWHNTNTGDAMLSGKIYDIVEGDFVDCGSQSVQITLKDGSSVTANHYPAPAGRLRISPWSAPANESFEFIAENVVGHDIEFGIANGQSVTPISENPTHFARGSYTIVLLVQGVRVDSATLAVSDAVSVPTGPNSNSQAPTRPLEKIQEDLQKAGVKDVPPDHFAANSLTVLLQAGLITPDSNGNINIDGNVTIGEGVTIFAKVLGVASKTDDMATAFAKAREAGIIRPGLNPDADFTRIELARLLAAALGVEASSVTREQFPFSDYVEIEPDMLGTVKSLYDLGIMRGFEDGSFRPNSILTRASIATIVDRVLGAAH